MRATAPFRRLLLLLLPLAGCDRASELRFDDDPQWIVSIAELKARGTSEAAALTEELAIRGRVVSSDRYGEFDRELVIEDASGGITLAAEHPALADVYPFGTLVTVRCNGLWLCDRGGKLVLSSAPGPYGATPVAQAEFPSRIRTEQAPEQAPEAAPLTIGAIDMRRVDTYVRLDGVRFIPADVCWCDTDPQTGRYVATERTIADAEGRIFRVRTAGTCLYAGEPVPEGTGSLKGIVDYFGGVYSLRPVNRGAEFATSAASPRAYP